MRWFVLFAIVALGLAGSGLRDASGATKPRIALVMGNSAYADIPLANPVNDARLMSQTLRELGFDVTEVLDADQITMKYAIVDFGERLDTAGKEAVGLFYYAGHGLQVGGENFLVPLGARIEKESHVAIEAVSAGWVLGEMEFAGNRMNFIILDACRNNPLTRSFRSQVRGLAQMPAPAGSLVAYSTAPGSVSRDGEGDNSPYTLALAAAMREPGMTVDDMFRTVRNVVMSQTDDAQVPWESSSLTGAAFIFNPAATQPAGRTVTVEQETLFWDSIKDSTDPADFEDFLATFPNSVFAGLAGRRLKKLGASPETVVAVVQSEAARTVDPTADPTPTGEPGTFDDGWAAYERDDYRSALKIWRPLAERGDAIAQYNLGVMYDNGEGVGEDNVQAVRWYRASAEQGDPDAQYSLAAMYDYGEGVAQDYVEAAKWYRAAADQDDAQAQYNLALMYDFGDGVAEDDVEAIKWYRRAASQGIVDAQYNLGTMYDYGEGVAENDVEAVKWYRKAADQGDADAQYSLALMYDYGEGVVLDDAEAIRWYLEAAGQDHASAQFNLGVMYDNGEGTPVDDAQAVEWYLRAANQGHVSAQYNLALMYDYGEGVALDDAAAVRWYHKAADQNHAGAQYFLGTMYDYGEGIPEDDAQAAAWYRKAAEQGHANAQYNLALMYDYGEGVALDDVEAVRWYHKSAEQDHVSAQYNLALMYDYGEGTPIDDAEAVEWYRRAAEQSHVDAQYNLGSMYFNGEGVATDYVKAYMWSAIAAASGKEEARANRDIAAREMNSSQIANADEMVRAWLAEHEAQ